MTGAEGDIGVFSTVLSALSSQVGVIATLMIVLYAGYRGWWRWGRDYDEMMKERNTWRSIALETIGVTEQVAGATEAIGQVATNLKQEAARNQTPRRWFG